MIAFFISFLLLGCAQNTPIGEEDQSINDSSQIVEESDIADVSVDMNEVQGDLDEENIVQDLPEIKEVVVESNVDAENVLKSQEAGFALSFPENVTIDTGKDAEFSLEVKVVAIADMEDAAPLGFDKSTALLNEKALKETAYGQNVDFAYPASQFVHPLKGNRYAQDFIVFSRFEVCDMALERTLYFIKDEHQVTITLLFPREKIATVLEDFVTTDADNCGDSDVWDFAQLDDLVEAFVSKSAPEEAQSWYDTFENIVTTISF